MKRSLTPPLFSLFQAQTWFLKFISKALHSKNIKPLLSSYFQSSCENVSAIIFVIGGKLKSWTGRGATGIESSAPTGTRTWCADAAGG
uniref:Uncharacterized protein n=1 Tax=Oryctolagus cuniculus TaxID=9986 RepID=A0A5F9DK30_RABIT